jgi:NTE family protein
MKIGIALSGGGARGFAHLGVLKALEEIGIKPHMVSGVSAGAIGGAFYCYGYSPEETLKILSENGILGMISPAFSWKGLLKMDKAEKVYHKHLKENSFEKLLIPLIIEATDIINVETVRFSKGELIKPVIASASIPMLFQPVEFENRLLVDGGLLNNLPAQCLKPYCDKIIAVNVNSIIKTEKVESMLKTFERTFNIIINNNIKESIAVSDVVLEPLHKKNYGILDLNHANEIYAEGYNYTLSKKEQILRTLSL